MKKLTPFILFMLLLATGGLHRAEAQLYVNLHGGLTLPQGDYADSRMSDHEWMLAQGHQHKGGAGRGWAAGLEVSYAMPFHKNLEVVLSGDFMQGDMNRDVQDYYEQMRVLHYSQCSLYEMKLPRYRNVPVMAGVRYCYPLTTLFDFYGEAMAGINLRMISDWSFAFTDGNWTAVDGQDFANYNNVKIYRYSPATTFAFRFGVGILIKKLVSVGASFNMLGNGPLSWEQEEITRYSIYGEMRENRNTNRIDYFSLNPTLVTVSVGIRFKAFSGARHVQDW